MVELCQYACIHVPDSITVDHKDTTVCFNAWANLKLFSMYIYGVHHSTQPECTLAWWW